MGQRPINCGLWPSCVPSLATFLICYKRGLEQLQLLATKCDKFSFHFIQLQIFSNFPCSIQPSFKSGHLVSKYIEFLTLRKKWGGGLDLLPLLITSKLSASLLCYCLALTHAKKLRFSRACVIFIIIARLGPGCIWLKLISTLNFELVQAKGRRGAPEQVHG